MITRKIGKNRGKPRLWLEGKILKDHGFEHGTQWDLIWPYLRVNPQGKRRVSGSPARPVIDISGSVLKDAGPIVQIECEQGVLKISNHP